MNSWKLNLDILRDDIDFDNPKMDYIREGFGQGLLDAGKIDNSVVALCADLTDSTKMNYFKSEFPERFIEIGIGEQNLATVASGMSAEGFYPFFSSYAMFSPGRNWEQIRTTICYNDRPCCVVGSHAGVSVGPDGGTHQAIEDLALMRVLPRMNVYSPADIVEAHFLTKDIARRREIAYIRLAREKTPVLFKQDENRIIWTPFKRLTLFEKNEAIDCVILVTGGLTFEALKASKLLFEKNINCEVVSISHIKPFPRILLVKYLENFEPSKIFTLEEHQIVGGFGSCVLEELSNAGLSIPVKRIGIEDVFGQSGEPYELIKYFKLDGESVCDIIKNNM